jgi:hypothetical protein
MGGPQVSMRIGKIKPFAHFLIGATRGSLTHANEQFGGDFSLFTLGAGGGVDLGLNRWLVVSRTGRLAAHRAPLSRTMFFILGDGFLRRQRGSCFGWIGVSLLNLWTGNFGPPRHDRPLPRARASNYRNLPSHLRHPASVGDRNHDANHPGAGQRKELVQPISCLRCRREIEAGHKSVAVYMFAQTVGVKPRQKSGAQRICFLSAVRGLASDGGRRRRARSTWPRGT